MDDFLKEATLEQGLQLLVLRRGNLIKQGEGLMDTLGQLGQGGRYQQLGELLKHVGVGTAVGGGAGLASSLMEPEHRRRPLSRAMTGALLGALGGGAYNMAQTAGGQLGPSTAPNGQRIDEAQAALAANTVKGSTPAQHAGHAVRTATDTPYESAKSLVNLATAPIQRELQGGATAGPPEPDKGLLASPFLPPAAGAAGLAADQLLRYNNVRLLPERATTAVDRVLHGSTGKQHTMLQDVRQQLQAPLNHNNNQARGLSRRQADKLLAQHGTLAPLQRQYPLDVAAHKQQYKSVREHNRQADVVQKQHQYIAGIKQRILADQAAIQIAQQQGNQALVQQLNNRISNARNHIQKLNPPPLMQHQPLPAKPQPPAMTVPRDGKGLPIEGHITGDTMRSQIKATRPAPGALRSVGRRVGAFALPAGAMQWYQEERYGNTSDALEWQRAQLQRRLQEAQSTVDP